MRAIMVMFDTLRYDVINEGILELPNFTRLKDRSVSFVNNYVCSMPCMPARRELHTGRPNFLHRSWGPLEPFDHSMPEILKKNGIYTHLSTDHYHYLEDGGATYHSRYHSWSCFRGQENDSWAADSVRSRDTYAPVLLHHDHQDEPLKTGRLSSGWQNVFNREKRGKEEKYYSQTQTFDEGISFIRRHKDADNWFLQIEAFDPHEPFDSPLSYLAHFFDPDHAPSEDWLPYAKVDETEQEIEDMRKKYYALVEFCDHSLGRVLDCMDEYDLWKDTMLIVNTDHGISLAEHDWWGKNNCPDYQEVSHIPLFVYDPRYQENGECAILSQTFDIPATLLDYFHIDIPKEMCGRPLSLAYHDQKKIRDYAIFGLHGSVINITDGKYVYMRYVRTPEEPLSENTLLPLRMNGFFTQKELAEANYVDKYSFTRGYPILEIKGMARRGARKLSEDLLFDVENDPKQLYPIKDETIEYRLCKALVEEMKRFEAPEELYDRFDLRKYL